MDDWKNGEKETVLRVPGRKFQICLQKKELESWDLHLEGFEAQMSKCKK